MQPSLIRRLLSVKNLSTGMIAASVLLSSGCKMTDSWGSKMPKFGMPDLAFGNKSKKDDGIEPPAMNFTPGGDADSALAQMPQTRRPYDARTADEKLPRSPYAVDDSPASSSAGRSLADLAQSDSEKILARQDQSTRNNYDRYLGNTPSRSKAEDMINSRTLPSDRNGLGSNAITQIPGGPLDGGYSNPGKRGQGPELPSSPELPGLDSSRIAATPNSGFDASRSAGGIGAIGTNPLDGSANQRVGFQNNLPSPSTDNLNSGLSSNNRNSAGSNIQNQSGLSLPPGLSAPPSMGPRGLDGGDLGQSLSSPMDNRFPAGGLPSGGLSSGNSISSSPGSTGLQPNTLPTAPATPQYAVPNPTGRFLPGSTGGVTSRSAALPPSTDSLPYGFPTGTTPSSTPNTSQGFPGQAAPTTTQPGSGSSLPAYPSTGYNSFQSQNAYPVQQVGYANNGMTAQKIPAAIPTANTGNSSYPVSHANATMPSGVVCDGDTCYIPSQQ